VALKVVDKHALRKSQKLDIILNEKEIMRELNHPFVAKLLFTLQTVFPLYFNLE